MEPTGGTPNTMAWRVAELERDVKALQTKVDRLMWSIVALSLTIAGSAITFAITVAGIR